MIVNSSVCIEAPRSIVWRYLSDLERASDWVIDLVSTKLDESKPKGKGCVRICELKNGKEAREYFTEWEEESAFTYQVLNAPMMKSASNSWSIEEVNGKVLVKSKAVIEFKGGPLGKVFGLMMSPLAKRSMQGYLAAFKFLVENGRVYKGKVSRLGKAPVVC